MEIKNISNFTDLYNEKFFGLTPNGESVSTYELSNKNGMVLQITNFGATVTSLKIPIKNDEIVDVVLGFDNLKAYIDSFDLESAPYFGTAVGRYAGRIGNATFELNGKQFQLDKNNGNNSLHGGFYGFSRKFWTVRRIDSYKNPSITLLYSSADGEEHFPAEMTVEITYTLIEENKIVIDYKAIATEDTIVNLTHHSYFNLDGHENDIRNQDVFINAKKILETSEDAIPTGRFLNLSNCPFDFTTPKKCPEKIDTTFVLDKQTKLAASLFSAKNNLKMDLYTDQPAVHVYVGGNCFGKIKGKENADYHPLSGVCFEAQNFPDAPNHSHFPNAILKKGETYRQKTIYQFHTF